MKYFFPLFFILIIFFIGCTSVNNDRYISPYERELIDKRWEKERQYNDTKRAVRDALREHERNRRK